MERLLLGLARRRRCPLVDVERESHRRRVVMSRHPHHGRSGLAVPATELREVRAAAREARVLHRLHEIVAGHGAAVVALEIQVHAAAEAIPSEQRVLHADDFGALFVDGRRVEIVDLDVLVGPHRMRHRTRVLGELGAAQEIDGGDAFHRARAHVARELLIAENREAFLERQLEPVAAGHAIAGPVVEIFVAHDALDGLVVAIGCGRRIRQYQLAVEDVEALVLHRAHVEVVGAEDHEGVKIVFAAEALLVPAHRTADGGERVLAARQVARRRPDLERDLAAGTRRETVLERVEIAGDQREQVGRLRKRVVPGGEMPAGIARPGGDPVAVG